MTYIRIFGRDEARQIAFIVMRKEEISEVTVTALMNNEEILRCVASGNSGDHSDNMRLYTLFYETIMR